MTEAEQFVQMDSPAFFGAVGKKIIAAKNAMINADVESDDGCKTHLNGVDIWWQDSENKKDTEIRFGVRDDSAEPMYTITIPTQWLAVSL